MRVGSRLLCRRVGVRSGGRPLCRMSRADRLSAGRQRGSNMRCATLRRSRHVYDHADVPWSGLLADARVLRGLQRGRGLLRRHGVSRRVVSPASPALHIVDRVLRRRARVRHDPRRLRRVRRRWGLPQRRRVVRSQRHGARGHMSCSGLHAERNGVRRRYDAPHVRRAGLDLDERNVRSVELVLGGQLHGVGVRAGLGVVRGRIDTQCLRRRRARLDACGLSRDE